MVFSLQEVLQPLHSAASGLPRLLSLSKKQQLGQDCYLASNPGLGQGSGVAGTTGAGQATEEVSASQWCGRGVVGPGEDIRICGVNSHILPCLQEELQAGLAVRGKNEGLDASTFTLDPYSREVGKHQAFKGGEGSLQWGESRGGTRRDGYRALGSDASSVFSDGQLGDLTLTSSVVQDEECQAGVTEKAPGLS